jgi:hypothetical protein
LYVREKATAKKLLITTFISGTTINKKAKPVQHYSIFVKPAPFTREQVP